MKVSGNEIYILYKTLELGAVGNEKLYTGLCEEQF